MEFEAEKYKELMYDIQRISNDEEIHKLIVEYVTETENSDNIRCIKDVIMKNSNDREFTKGKTYRCYIMQGHSGIHGMHAKNDSQTPHRLGLDKFFSEHFGFI